jgi:cytochrome b subunit of formate dehydrogenase
MKESGMAGKILLSKQTRNNWLVDLALFSSALVAAISGIYFLFLPQGGFRGGRNPFYDLPILFSRATWEDLHTWGGLLMIAAVAVHLPLHWSWVVNMAKRMVKESSGKCGCMNQRGRFNLIVNLVIAASFLLTAISGIYLFFVPGGRWAVDPLVLFTRSAWKLFHTWSGVVLVIAAVLHFAIHWKWVSKVTHKMVASFVQVTA